MQFSLDLHTTCNFAHFVLSLHYQQALLFSQHVAVEYIHYLNTVTVVWSVGLNCLLPMNSATDFLCNVMLHGCLAEVKCYNAIGLLLRACGLYSDIQAFRRAAVSVYLSIVFCFTTFRV